MRGLIEEPPPGAILLQVLHLIRREQELRGMQHAIESSHTVDIEKFVPKASIDDRFTPYYLAPEDQVGQEA